MKRIDRTGETKTNNNGSKMTIKQYINSRKIYIEFEDGCVVESNYTDFKNGLIKSLNDKTVFGVGYIGIGEYTATKKNNGNKKKTEQYSAWTDMLRRCYEEKFKNECQTYKEVTCCEEWKNFQNFATWFDNNIYRLEGEKMNLDKDILCKGNKIYSPEKCVFTPPKINCTFTKHDKDRGEFYIGVYYSKQTGKFISRCNIGNGENIKYLGQYETEIEAFEKYKEFKEKYIKEVAEQYKGKIPQKLYDAMYNWKVEITD